ncbi:hypothetical protein JCM10212_000234 [Sporobolomyces blumeae]
MADQGTLSTRKAVWCVQWRLPQQRKNKTWENDGWLLLDGPSAKLLDAEGKQLAQKNITRELVPQLELPFVNRDIRMDYESTWADFHKSVKGVGTSHGPPPSAVPSNGPQWFSRPHQAATPVVPQRFQTPTIARSVPASRAGNQNTSAPRPRSALGGIGSVQPFRADTPEVDRSCDASGPFGSAAPPSAIKKWQNPILQKAFKVPTPVRKTSPGVEYGAQVGESVRKERERSFGLEARKDTGRDALRDRQAAQEKRARANEGGSTRHANGKGKEREFDVEEELENSPTSPPRPRGANVRGSPDLFDERNDGVVGRNDGDDPNRAKKRKFHPAVETPIAGTTGPVARQPRQSAADMALLRSMGQSASHGSKRARPTPADQTRSKGTRSPRSTAEDDDDGLFLDTSHLDDVFGPNPAVEDIDWGQDLADGEFGLEGSDDESAVKEEEAEQTGEALPARTRYFNVQWRKQSSKKNQVWEGDGVVRIDKSHRATLRDPESGKEMGSVVFPKNVDYGDSPILRMGNKEVEIGEECDRTAFEGSESSAPAVSRPFSAPAPSRASNPLASRTSTPAVVKPIPTLSASASKTKGFNLPGIAPTVGSNSFYKAPSSEKKVPAPVHDPKVDGRVVMRRPDDDHQATYNKKNMPVVDVVIDPLIGDKLREHQKEGVRFMYEAVMGMRTAGQGCILADDMGLGKTIQSIALIWTLLKQTPYFGSGGYSPGTIERAMIVCPVTLIKNWSSEIKKWLGKDGLRVMVADSPTSVKTFATARSYQVLIVGYEKLRSAIDDVKYAQPPVGLIICDEGHRLKSASSQLTKALQTLSCQRRVILSGTPIQNNLGEFFAMMDFVNPGLLNDAAYFKRHYENPIMRSRDPHATTKEKEAGQDAFESLSEIQRNFVLRRTNDDIQSTLPPKLEYTVFLIPNEHETKIYREVLSSSAVRSLLGGTGGKDQLSLLTLLRKCSNTPGLLMQQAEEEAEQRKADSIFTDNLVKFFADDTSPYSFELSAKLNALGTLLAHLRHGGDEKIVVVSNFTATLDIVERHCKSSKYPYCRLDGKTDQKIRIAMVDQFNRGASKNNFIFLLSSKSGGTGLNIIGASRLVLLDSDWNPSNDLQAMARIHREGQKRPCVIYRFLTTGTIDEKIYQRQITKLALSGSVMEEDATVASKSGNAFTFDDLRNIFMFHSDTTCQTHDLLGCRCQTGEDDAEPFDEDEDDASGTGDSEDDYEKGFALKARKNLSILRTWTHYDCSSSATVRSIEDRLLRKVVYKLVETAPEDERDVRAHDDMDDAEKALVEKGERWVMKGGQVGWVFGKKSGRAESSPPPASD